MLQIFSRLTLLSVFVIVGLGRPRLSNADREFTIDLNRPQRSRYPLAIPVPVHGEASITSEVLKVASFDLDIAGWFTVMDRKSFVAEPSGREMGIQVESWKKIGAFGVIKFRARTIGANNIELNFKLFEVEKGSSPALARNYRGNKKDVRALTHRWCNEVVKHLTGENGFFGSKIAFVSNGSKRSGKFKTVAVMDFDGAAVRTMSRNRSINILPAWSPNGRELAYTSYMRHNPDVYVVGADGGRPKQVSKRVGMNTGASWSPDGRTMAVTLSKDGNPEIYLINSDTGSIIKRLTNSRHIDTSPAWSPDGTEIAFVSDREGAPQIFVMSSNGNNQRRVSMNGNYNTTPTWSPVKGKRLLAYTAQTGRAFDIVTLDLKTSKMVRITQNEGSNEEPSFSPNGRVIAFSSARREGAGIYLANADGTGKAVRVYSGKVTSLDWGPAPKP